ncbi:tetratricopeptide repeat protein [Jejudonia soesokkakensis]|uniref:Tetratricopeptide repeat protein n=1 Tax=Jejudonia soesokkakensis TaxID=1323432 RepID=A0ABW2MXH6_9FLAO
MKKIFLLTIIIGLFSSCSEKNEKFAMNATDYDAYLSENSQSLKSATEAKEFWSKRLDADTTGVGDIAPLASAYTSLFSTTGTIENLKIAEGLTKKGLQISANNKDGFARALALNYISQHRFKEAKQVLEESYANVSLKRDTELMLFDVSMELGEYEAAKNYLDKVKKPGDYNYLIRLSKWSDYRGDLDAAIKYMEEAKDIAVASGNNALKIWTYSNLGDYYGHAGRIKDSYTQYLKTLALQPDNYYVKKQLAWMAYAWENNSKEANRILDSISAHHKIPDYYLLKAEIAAFNDNPSEAKKYTDQFTEAVENQPDYGAMYNAYLIEIYAEDKPEKALALAENEISNRATPETYHLLAYAQLKAGHKEKALQTIETHVEGKTYEPMAQFHSALVYKANGKTEEAHRLKEELLSAGYELGPVIIKDVKTL